MRRIPREENAPNRPLLFDEVLLPKPACFAARTALPVAPVPGPGVWLVLGAAAAGVARRREKGR